MCSRGHAITFHAWRVASAVSLLLWSGTIDAADVALSRVPQASSTVPMAITSESMSVKTLDHRVIFERNVLVKKDDMDLRADRVEVVLTAPESTKNPLATPSGGVVLTEENVDRIEARGHVIVVQGKKNATADQAVYHRAGETIVLTGRPETWEDGYRIQGSKITIWLKEQRSVVDDSRVVIYPEESRPPAPGSNAAGNVPLPQPGAGR